jgi:hypothetical protein
VFADFVHNAGESVDFVGVGVNAHRGGFNVSSPGLGQGATFTLTLPAAKAAGT